jgi:hypothetical protein
MFICTGVLLLAVTACEPDIHDALDLPRSSLIVIGRVADESGTPIAGARVEMTYNPLLCSVAPRKRQDATTAADGHYREVVETVADERGCVRLRVSANGYHPDSAARNDVNFKLDAPFDSVRTNFTLRRR